MFGSYEDFRLQNTLIRHIYRTSPQGTDPDGQDPTTERRAKQAMLRTVGGHSKYWFNYHEFLVATFVRTFCCSCVKNTAWYEAKQLKLSRHQKAFAKLKEELDVCNMI